MFEVKNFDNWIEDKIAGKFGSGASEKLWIINPETNERGLFKFPKDYFYYTQEQLLWLHLLEEQYQNLKTLSNTKPH